MKSSDLIVSANDIKPQVHGISDFFSWNLYRFVRKNPTALKVWLGNWNTITGFDAENPVVYIGRDRDKNWIHARSLRNLCTVGSGLEMFAYGGCHGTKDWQDITEQFWKSYLENGVCAIHGDFAHKWHKTGNERQCEYCRKVQTKIEVTQIVSSWEWKSKHAS